jgi:hypothetical protein
MPRNPKNRNPGGGRRANGPPPRGRGTATRGERSPRGAMSEESIREQRLKGEIGRDPNDPR